MRTPSELTQAERREVRRRWESGESSAGLDREFDLRLGATRKWANREKWNKVGTEVKSTRRAKLHKALKQQPVKEEAVVVKAETDKEAFAKDVKIEKLESRNRHVSRLYKEAVKEKASVDRLVETIRDAITAMDPVTPYVTPTQLTGEDEHGVVALLSDLHVGEVVNPSETNNLSEYNMEKFVERLEIWTNKVIRLTELRRSRMHAPNLEIFMMGDIVSGDIHEELSNTNAVSVVDQVIASVFHLSGSLLTLCQNFEEVNVSVVAGNHGRIKRKPYFKSKQIDNWDYMIGLMLALNLRNQENLTFHIPQAFWYIREVMNTRFLMMHGDGIQSWAGIPYYGIQRMVHRMFDLVGRDLPFDRVVMGHFHDPVDTESFSINGTFKGGDDFSIGKMYLSGRPSQTLMYVHPMHGIVSTERLYLDEGRRVFQIPENETLKELLASNLLPDYE